jgi:hypothetical protein
MATYTVTNKYLIDDFAVLQLLTPSEIAVGQSITVADVDATFNGTYTVRALPQYLYIGVDTKAICSTTTRYRLPTRCSMPRLQMMSSAPQPPAQLPTRQFARG